MKRSLSASGEAPKWKKAKREEASSDEDDESSQRTTSHGGSSSCYKGDISVVTLDPVVSANVSEHFKTVRNHLSKKGSFIK